MSMLQNIISSIDSVVGTPLVIGLLATGLFMTLRLGLIQVRRLGHGLAVTSGKYDDPSEPGDVSHFQALTTALSATVGIGNIAGVAIAIHWGGPGALFWMWLTAFFGMALKYSEVTLAQQYRVLETPSDGTATLQGSVSGGPMYYIEKGLGGRWKPMAVFFAGALMITSFFTGNAIQANTIADNLLSEFSLPVWVSGLVTSLLVGAVILGGIKRIGRVTSILAPVMALIYVSGALIILTFQFDQIPGAFATIFREAFNPTAGVAGTGVGAIMTTVLWGVRRGLFSNEAGQGSAPIAHAAAQTDEPVSEGVVALLEPFIDTLMICTMTGLVIITTGVWAEAVPTRLVLSGGDASYVTVSSQGTMTSVAQAEQPEKIEIRQGQPQGDVRFAWHEVAVERFFTDPEHRSPFSGTLWPAKDHAVDSSGKQHAVLYGPAVESGAPMTKLAFERGLSSLGQWGGFIVLLSVLLFGISTAISWSYYGDRCANYLFGAKAILPYKLAFVVMHFVGAVTSLNTIWSIGDIALSFCTFPNLIAVLLLSGTVSKLTKSYFERQPWRRS